MTALGELMTLADEEGEDWGHNPPEPPGSESSKYSVPSRADLPDQCVSSVTVGQNVYWCEAGKAGHDGLCRGSDPWGGHCEWRWWAER